MVDRTELGPGARFLFVATCLVVIVAGMKAASSILLPFALASFLAVLTVPVYRWLEGRGIPSGPAIGLAALVDASILGILVLMVVGSVSELQEQVPAYVARFDTLQGSWIESLRSRGIPVRDLPWQLHQDPEAISELVGATIQRAVRLASNVFLVVLIMLFILAEATVIPAKLRTVLGRGTGDLGRFAKIGEEVQSYLWIKTLVSLATGLLIGLWAWFMGLDFPILLGIIGFVLNFVPTIGSIIAAIPGIALGVLQYGVAHGSLVGIGYLVINTIFGNMIEPVLQGRRLGLSSLVVILSLLFWGWVWGPVGMILSVPLTMVVKIMLENTEDLRWMAVLLDRSVPVGTPESLSMTREVPEPDAPVAGGVGG